MTKELYEEFQEKFISEDTIAEVSEDNKIDKVGDVIEYISVQPADIINWIIKNFTPNAPLIAENCICDGFGTMAPRYCECGEENQFERPGEYRCSSCRP